MKILYHHRTSGSDGSAVHIDGLVDALRAQGHDVVMVGPAVSKRRSGQVGSGLGSRMRALLPRWLYEGIEIFYNAPEWIRLQALISHHSPDVIYERYNLFLLSGVVAARISRIPLIVEVNSPLFAERSAHGGISLRAAARLAERQVWRSADAVVAVTQVLADLVDAGGRRVGPTVAMHNGVDTALFCARRVVVNAKRSLALEGRRVIGFTGFVREWNGLDDVIDNLRFLPEDVVLLVVGDGPALDSLRQRAKSAGMADRVHFAGLVARPQIAEYVSAFDIALQPAANAYASPLKLFEYLALGRAVVAPDQPNLREVLEHGRNAWLFDPSSAQGMLDAISRLVEDAPLRQFLARNASNSVEELGLTWSHNASRVAALANQLCLRRGALHSDQSGG